MNETAREWYQLWDNTLNVVWKLLEANLSEAEMEALRKEEREWIASKDVQVQAAGQEIQKSRVYLKKRVTFPFHLPQYRASMIQ